jgi:dimethylhistidine N-methyltransferase
MTLDFTVAETTEAIHNCISKTLGEDQRRVVFFPGSTIGNFHPAEAVAFLSGVHELCGRTGGLVLGADLRKDPALLHAAYNDARGVTAAFNVNVLRHLNREYGTDFDTARFRHYAFYNPIAHRIEMHLVSLEDQQVHVAGEKILFARGESIWTESSYKYDDASMNSLLAASGWTARAQWSDSARLFGVWYCEPTPVSL